MMAELHGGKERKKLTKKERKKISTDYINHTAPVAEQERSITVDAECLTPSECHLDGQPGLSSFSLDKNRNSTYGGMGTLMDGKRVSPENTDHSVCLMPPPTKRPKLVSSQHILQSNNPGVASSQLKVRSVQDTLTCRDVHLQSTLRSEFCNDSVVSASHGQSFSNYRLSKDFPSPLATKTYYSQKSNRLRSAVGHMFTASSSRGLYNNVMSPQLSQESTELQTSSHRQCIHEQVGSMFQKKISEGDLDESKRCTPTVNFSNITPLDTTPKAQNAPVELLRNKHLPKAYSFAGNSGQYLGTMQQPSGSVPVL